MRTRKNIKFMLVLFCALFAMLCVYLLYILSVYGTRWIASPYNTHIKNVKETVAAGEIRDRTGVVLAYTDDDGVRRYASEKAVRRALCHVVGDTYGQTLGAEAAYSKYTLGFDMSLAERFKQYLNRNVTTGSDVSLTVDAALSRYAYACMDEYWGAVVVLNYRTGEILASVSQPTFDPERMADYLSGDAALANSAMVNRVSMGRYTPGSTFKIVTLIAALRYINGVEDMTFPCAGPLAFDEDGKYLPEITLPANYTKTDAAPSYDREKEYAQDDGAAPETQQNYLVIRDYQGEYHGETTLEDAFAQSCNTTFARLAMQVGAKRMQKTAEELGIGTEFQFRDSVTVYKSSYAPGDTQFNLAWSGVGQYKDLLTPLQLCMLSGAVANDGVMMEPKLLRSVTTPSGAVTRLMQSESYKALLSKKEARTVQDYMRAVVAKGSGKRAAIEGLDVCGKTGTAEISSDKTAKTHAWFTGFVLDEEHPLAICIVLEQAGGGGSVAAPMAGKILKKAVALGY